MEKSEFGGGQCKFLCLDCGDGYMILVFLSKSIGPYIPQEWILLHVNKKKF